MSEKHFGIELDLRSPNERLIFRDLYDQVLCEKRCPTRM